MTEIEASHLRIRMRRITLQMYITLDGINEFPEYPGSGDPPIGEEDPISKEMWVKNWESTDTLLFDEETYGQWVDFWPSSKRRKTEDQFYHEMSQFAEKAQKVVFSDKLKEAPWVNSRILKGDIKSGIDQLRREHGKNMALVAPVLAQQFMRLGLIDDYFLTFFPVILGKGQRLFDELERQQTLKLVEAKHFKHGEVFVHYQTIRL